MNIQIVNVFSKNNRGGNPCAIVDNVSHLNTDEMQSMATQLNLPETVFIIPEKNDYLLRFFATKGELPLCCHGALGTLIIFLNQILKNPSLLKLTKVIHSSI